MKNKKLKDKFYKALKKKLPKLQKRKTKVWARNERHFAQNKLLREGYLPHFTPKPWRFRAKARTALGCLGGAGSVLTVHNGDAGPSAPSFNLALTAKLYCFPGSSSSKTVS